MVSKGYILSMLQSAWTSTNWLRISKKFPLVSLSIQVPSELGALIFRRSFMTALNFGDNLLIMKGRSWQLWSKLYNRYAHFLFPRAGGKSLVNWGVQSVDFWQLRPSASNQIAERNHMGDSPKVWQTNIPKGIGQTCFVNHVSARWWPMLWWHCQET